MSDRDNDFGAFISGFVIGGLVGAAVALLLAPQSGEETRTKIRQRGIELRDQVEETAAEARARAEQLAQEARIRAEDLQKRGQAVYDEQRSKLEKAIEAGKKAAQRKRSEIEGEEPA
jgi:gas vesicle protein